MSSTTRQRITSRSSTVDSFMLASLEMLEGRLETGLKSLELFQGIPGDVGSLEIKRGRLGTGFRRRERVQVERALGEQLSDCRPTRGVTSEVDSARGRHRHASLAALTSAHFPL